jgi:hypothetical protein
MLLLASCVVYAVAVAATLAALVQTVASA